MKQLTSPYQSSFNRHNSNRRNSNHPGFTSVSSFIPAALILAAGGLVIGAQDVAAQVETSVGVMTFDPDSGFVEIDNNAFDIQTGEFSNTSNIPLPTPLPERTEEGVALPVRSDLLAPNTVELSPDFEYIQLNFDEQLREDRGVGTYTLNRDSLELTTEFDLRYRVGSHDFGEGIQVIVTDANGEEVSRESAFVRGDSIQFGPNPDGEGPVPGEPIRGERLPTENSLSVTYGIDDRVELRVLNIRRDGFPPRESGVYFSESGELIVEDLQNGGDLDFDDGEYFGFSEGQGEADASVEEQEVVTEEVVTETPLEPETREEESVEADEITTIVEMDAEVEEERIFGEVEIPDTAATSVRLGHAVAARTEDGSVLVYDRYARAGQVRAGSDGLGLTGQLAPLVNNPKAPPTLLTGNITFNPFVADNEAGLTGTFGVTQFLTRTHQVARDAAGNEIMNPDGSGRRLIEPAGLFSNRRYVGYVPPTPGVPVAGDEIPSVDGIFTLPSDQPVEISPPDAQRVGRGNAAYTDNVGGLLVERSNGAITFVPQWTNAGYEQEPLSLEAGEATRIIYALVPQQPGQNLRLGQSYPVTGGAGGYQIADGGFTVISADQQPENFARETAEVYAVEDTLANRTNAVTPNFNGIQGFYAEVLGGNRMPTLDVELADEADARVGNTLYPLPPDDPGQLGYAETTVAAGFYLGGSLTGGFGNQRNTVLQTGGTMEIAFDELRTRRTFNIFETPLTQVDTVVTETTTTSQASGTALFDINERGELTNARFLESDRMTVGTTARELERTSNVVRGDEVLIASTTEETFEPLETEVLEFDQEASVREESEANFSPVRGEIALGGVLNFGNTPWTAAANTLRAELFARDTIFGREGSGSELGWRAEAIFHLFGEVKREAYQYDGSGNVVPVYQTEPAFDENGQQLFETLVSLNGFSEVVPKSQYVLDESGNKIPQMTGTGTPQGPGLYLRVEDAFDDDEGLVVAGGLELSF